MATEMEKFRAALEKKYGARLTDPPKGPQYEVISTGSLTLDVALRTGGWVRGRTHEIVGPPQVGKTTMSILSAAEHQRATGKAVGWVDMEQSFDWDWARRLGLDTSAEKLIHIFPDDSENVSDQLKDLIRSDLISIAVVDSIGGMESRKAFEKDAEESTMGRNAQIITRMVKAAASYARQHHVTILFINQLRANLGYAGQDLPAGPRALGYNTTTSIRMNRRSGPVADTVRTLKVDGVEEEVGRLFVGKVTRNRVAPAGRQAEWWLFNQPTAEFGPVGIDRVDEAASLGIRMGVIGQKGAFYTLPGREKAVQGRKGVTKALAAEPDLINQIRDEAVKSIAHEVIEEEI